MTDRSNKTLTATDGAYSDAKNPRWEPGRKTITLDVLPANGTYYMPYTADPRGVEFNDPNSAALYELAAAGTFGEVADVTQEALALRASFLIERRQDTQRQLIREANDVCQPLAEEKDLGIITDDDLVRYKRWALYRQALRKLDVTEDVEWPARPE